MPSKFLLAAAGLAGAAVVIINKLDRIEERLDRIEKAEKEQPATKTENWDEIADVVFTLIQGKDATPKKTKRKVAFSAAKGVSKAAGRAAWNKITRKDK